MDIKEKTKIVRGASLFAGLADDDIAYIAKVAKVAKFSPGEILIDQGEQEAGAYVIVGGLVKIYKMTPEGEEVNLALLGEGEIVGEMSLFNQVVRSATVEAVRETLVLDIDGRSFRELIEKKPKIAVGILNVVIQRLIKNHEKIKKLRFENLYHRVWGSLEILSDHFPGGVINLSHEELSEIVGATRPRVTEVLNKLQEEDKIELQRQKIMVK